MDKDYLKNIKIGTELEKFFIFNKNFIGEKWRDIGRNRSWWFAMREEI